MFIVRDVRRYDVFFIQSKICLHSSRLTKKNISYWITNQFKPKEHNMRFYATQWIITALCWLNNARVDKYRSNLLIFLLMQLNILFLAELKRHRFVYLINFWSLSTNQIICQNLFKWVFDWDWDLLLSMKHWPNNQFNVTSKEKSLYNCTLYSETNHHSSQSKVLSSFLLTFLPIWNHKTTFFALIYMKYTKN